MIERCRSTAGQGACGSLSRTKMAMLWTGQTFPGIGPSTGQTRALKWAHGSQSALAETRLQKRNARCSRSELAATATLVIADAFQGNQGFDGGSYGRR